MKHVLKAALICLGAVAAATAIVTAATLLGLWVVYLVVQGGLLPPM